MLRLKYILCALLLVVLTSCTTANHGTFVSSTYVAADDEAGSKMIGEVTGKSSQTWFLYVFPIGPAPSTSKAISDAKSKHKATKYLTDLSIDDQIYWKFGYSQRVILVEANSYK